MENINYQFPAITEAFNGFEVHPCMVEHDEKGVEFITQCEPHEADFWSVYVHLCKGGLSCIADFESEDLANGFIEFMESFKKFSTCETLQTT